MAEKKYEVWLRGPVDGIPATLQPVAHALLQAREEVNTLMEGFPEALLWEKPAGVASPGFHLQHIAGVIDRLFTYAKGNMLNAGQLQYLKQEEHPVSLTCKTIELVEQFNRQVDKALVQLAELRAPLLGDGPHRLDHLEVQGVLAVGEVEPGHVEAGVDQPFQHRGIARARPDGGHDLGPAHALS